MTYDEHQPDPTKTYYYAFRAVDNAGNSSSLVGDSGTTVLGVSTQATATPKAGGSTTIVLPKETAQGQVLPESTEASQQAGEVTEESKGAVESAKNKNRSTLLILAGVGFIGYLLYRKTRKS